MTPEKTAKILTEEIIRHYRLPYQVCYGFIHARLLWAFAVGFDLGRVQNTKRKPVVKFDPSGKTVKVYGSISEAARAENCHKSAISQACTGATKSKIKGHYWRYLDPNDYYTVRKIKQL